MQLSIIVCTHNRAYAILGCLNSIVASLEYAHSVNAEIVVVDNASIDDTAPLVEKWAATCAFPVQLVAEPKKGLANARNRGIRAAQGALLAFTDDDCRLSRTYAAELLTHDGNDAGPVLRGGRVELGDAGDLPLSIKTEKARLQWKKPARWTRTILFGTSVGASMVVGCNISMRREVAERIGPFDAHFGAGTQLPGGEDTDFFIRAYRVGVTLEYVPDMVVYHHHGRKDLADGQKLMKNYMLGTGALYMKYFCKDFNTAFQIYWDIKSMVKAQFSGKKRIQYPYCFTPGDKVKYCAVGAGRYLFIQARALFFRSENITTTDTAL